MEVMIIFKDVLLFFFFCTYLGRYLIQFDLHIFFQTGGETRTIWMIDLTEGMNDVRSLA